MLTTAGKIATYSSLAHVATTVSVAGTAAHRVLMCVYWFMWPFAETWSQVAHAFLPGSAHARFLVRKLLTCGAAVGLLSALATILPATMGPKADPLTTPEVIKPEWFFYVSFRWLKIFSLTTAVLSTGFIVAAMVLWPWIDVALRKITKIEEISVYIGILGTFALIGLTLWEAIVDH